GQASRPHGQAPWTLREHGLQRAPAELRSREDRANDDGHGGADRKGRPHDAVDELVGIEGRDVDGAVPRRVGVKRQVPVEAVDERRDARHHSAGDDERRPKSTLTRFRPDGCDHDPCFSPVSWKKTSSSDLSNGRSSLTPIPASVSLRLISMLFSGLTFRWIAPF